MTSSSKHPLNQACTLLGSLPGVYEATFSMAPDGLIALLQTKLCPPDCIVTRENHLTMMVRGEGGGPSSLTLSLSFGGNLASFVEPVLKDDFRSLLATEGQTILSALTQTVMEALSFIAFCDAGRKRKAFEDSIFVHVGDERRRFFRIYLEFCHSRLKLKGTEEERALWDYAIQIVLADASRSFEEDWEALEDKDSQKADELLEAFDFVCSLPDKLTRDGKLEIQNFAEMSASGDPRVSLFWSCTASAFGDLLEETYSSEWAAFAWGEGEERRL